MKQTRFIDTDKYHGYQGSWTHQNHGHNDKNETKKETKTKTRPRGNQLQGQRYRPTSKGAVGKTTMIMGHSKDHGHRGSWTQQEPSTKRQR